MSEHERPSEEILGMLREGYNPPPATPREEMWTAIRGRLPRSAEAGEASGGDPTVVELDARRRARTPSRRRMAGLAVAAAALVVLGVGIGRMSTRPASGPESAGPALAAAEPSENTAFRTAATEHLRGTEALLTMVRSDARSGEMDPRVRLLAEGMLTQTRLFLDASEGSDTELRRLMEDLELVLAQIVAVTEDGSRARSELDLALRGAEGRDVIERIRTLSGPTMAGT